VQIKNNSSWSCPHGLERWRSNCGCRLNSKSKWNQKWRKELRAALDWLRDELAQSYERTMKNHMDYPWKLRDGYIDVILNETEPQFEKFINEHIGAEISKKNLKNIFDNLEMQKFTMLMYTSCGWFFDDVSGIETAHILQYAARAIELTNENEESKIEEKFIQMLSRAQGNIAEIPNAKHVYMNLIK